MELKALWDRIVQLEMTVLSQSKEIDNLKLILKQNNLLTTDCMSRMTIPNGQTGGLKSMGPILLSSSNTRNLLTTPPRQNTTSTVHRNSSVPAFQPYHMSPLVHPSSAIPPISNKPIINLTNLTKDQHNHAHQIDNRFNSGLNDRLRSQLTKPSHPNNAQKRYTIHAPPLAGNFDLDLDVDSAENSPDSRRSRQSFVERSSGCEDYREDPHQRDAEIGNELHERTVIDCYSDSSESDGLAANLTQSPSKILKQRQPELRNKEDAPVSKSQSELEKMERLAAEITGETCKAPVSTSCELKHPNQDLNKRRKVQQQTEHILDNQEITLVSYTEPDDQSNNNLAEYLVGKVIEKSKLPTSNKDQADDAPHVNYIFKRIQRSEQEARKENEQNDWLWPVTAPAKLPDKLQLLLKNSPFQ